MAEQHPVTFLIGLESLTETAATYKFQDPAKTGASLAVSIDALQFQALHRPGWLRVTVEAGE